MPATPAEWTVLSMLKWATAYFNEKGISNSRFSIEWLLASVLDVKRLDLYLIYDRPLAEEELEQLRPLVKRRASHEPLQYITGETDFFNTVIKVRPGVLIPRPETEQLVELALDTYSEEPVSVLDIGTGSGCIAIALKKNRPDWKVTAMDVSPDALTIAKENASLNETEILFLQEDLFSPGIDLSSCQFDLIVSNPPYILEEEKKLMNREVYEHEPAMALFCESTRIMYGAVEELSRSILKKNGHLLLELNEAKGAEVQSLFETDMWESQLLPDYAGKERFFLTKKIL